MSPSTRRFRELWAHALVAPLREPHAFELGWTPSGPAWSNSKPARAVAEHSRLRLSKLYPSVGREQLRGIVEHAWRGYGEHRSWSEVAGAAAAEVLEREGQVWRATPYDCDARPDLCWIEVLELA